jgi:RND family efflux transporter MFP subunit
MKTKVECCSGARIGSLFSVVGAALLASCSQPEPAVPPVQPVLVTRVRLNAATAMEHVLTATIQARSETDLSFRVGGRVAARMVDVGQRVKTGQALARLDTGDYAVAVSAAAEQVNAARVDALQAAADAARLQRLRDDEAVGAAEAERMQAQADVNHARLNQATHQFELARNRLSYATLVAPYDGIVTAVKLEPGQLVSDQHAVMSVARESGWEVVADVPESLVGQARQGSAMAVLWTQTDLRFRLRLRELSPVANAGDRTFRARYSMAGTDDAVLKALRLGMTAELMLTTPEPGAMVWLPAAAVWKTAGAPSIWLVNEQTGTLSSQAVDVRAYSGDAVRVAGLKDGSLVVVAGVQKLDASMKVRPISRSGSGLNLDGVLPEAEAVPAAISRRGG